MKKIFILSQADLNVLLIQNMELIGFILKIERDLLNMRYNLDIMYILVIVLVKIKFIKELVNCYSFLI